MNDITYEITIVQDGQTVAQVSGADVAAVLQEASQYAAIYQQDGPIIVSLKAVS